MRREVIAFFDVDHTISRRATAVPFIMICIKRGYIRWWTLLAAPFLFIAYRFFSVKMETLFKLSLPYLTGLSRATFDSIAEEAYHRFMEKSLYPGALREMEQLRKEGTRVILATSSPFEAVYPLVKRCGIGAADVIATQFAYDAEGKFMGKLVGMPVFSRHKCSIIQDFAERSGADLYYCSFYSDSIHDLPLLNSVGRPVAANPDLRLRFLARRRGWVIKDFTK